VSALVARSLTRPPTATLRTIAKTPSVVLDRSRDSLGDKRDDPMREHPVSSALEALASLVAKAEPRGHR